jgi:peptide deformylase
MIVTDESILRLPCSEASIDEAKDIVFKLEQELKHSADIGSPGIGLAAPQIGIHKKVAIVRIGDFKLNLANAIIDQKFDKFKFDNEGCLSFPGKLISSYRYNEIHVSNNLFEPKRFIVTGIVSVVCQHELEHLDNILLIDHVDANVNLIQKNKKIRPNDQCICGSNKKYKKCCGAK